MAQKELESFGKNCNHNHNHNVAKKQHDQEFVSIMSKLPMGTFNDGVANSAYKLGPELLGNFVGEELGGLISSLSNGFDFDF